MSKILKFASFTRTQKSWCLENKKSFFQIKKFINYTSSTTLWMTKDSFVAEVNFYFGVSTTTTSCFKMYSLCKIWKSLLIMLFSHPSFALFLRAKFISFFLVCIFLYSDWIWREIFGLHMNIYGINLHIQYEYRKIQTRNKLYLDTSFHTEWRPHPLCFLC